MKYYYKGKLVRTSDNEYKFAGIYEDEDGTIATICCSKTYEGVNKRLSSEINDVVKEIDFYERSIKAYEEGKTHIWEKNYKVELNQEEIETYKRYLQDAKRRLQLKNNHYKVVELEAK